MTRLVSARAPTRIDLGGGWTDVPPYCDREGGFVCNVAIARHATCRLTSSASGAEPADPIARVALRRHGLSGIAMECRNDFPVSAGLGGSSAASAAIVGAITTWKHQPIRRAEIAEEGRRIEVEEMGIAGGRQDHYAATHGGALALTFTDTVSVRRIDLAPDTRRDLVARSILIYTGESRISGGTITAVLGAYTAGDKRVLGALARMRELAQAMANALGGGDLDGVGAMLGEHWHHQRSLHPTIPTPRIDAIIDRAVRAGALGGKAMGASGGGSVLVMTRAGEADAVRQAIAPLGELLDFEIDDAGLTVADNREVH